MKKNGFEKVIMGVSLMMIGVLGCCIMGCGQGETPQQTAAETPVPEEPRRLELGTPAEGSMLLLSQAQFVYEDEESGPKPGPARLVIYRWNGGEWISEVIEDQDSNVFHKAAWIDAPASEPGILTIGAMGANLKLWHKKDGEWMSRLLWSETFGGKFDRLRDFEIGDVDGDGVRDIVIATHDQGVVAVVKYEDGEYTATEVTRKEKTFVHEVEIADIDGDGRDEFFTTPSHPNKMDGTVQPGAIDGWEYEDGEYRHFIVDDLQSRHAKEILAVTLTGEDKPVLFTALEGENLGGTGGGDSTRIRMYRFGEEGTSKSDIASLPGNLCRFLTYGDTDGDGEEELIASTKDDGIWKLTPGEDGWNKQLAASGTSGFEHATYLKDLDGDGREEIYVASDNEGELRVYYYNGRGYSAEVIDKLKEHTITFNITADIIEAK